MQSTKKATGALSGILKRVKSVPFDYKVLMGLLVLMAIRLSVIVVEIINHL